MGQAERSASSTRRGPSTPTAPDSEGSPPRRAIRNSLSHLLSREEMGAGKDACAAARARGDLEGVDILGCEVSRVFANRGVDGLSGAALPHVSVLQQKI